MFKDYTELADLCCRHLCGNGQVLRLDSSFDGIFAEQLQQAALEITPPGRVAILKGDDAEEPGSLSFNLLHNATPAALAEAVLQLFPTTALSRDMVAGLVCTAVAGLWDEHEDLDVDALCKYLLAHEGLANKQLTYMVAGRILAFKSARAGKAVAAVQPKGSLGEVLRQGLSLYASTPTMGKDVDGMAMGRLFIASLVRELQANCLSLTRPNAPNLLVVVDNVEAYGAGFYADLAAAVASVGGSLVVTK